jgi:prevent-host-death family protein
MYESVGVRELRQNLSKHLEEVKAGKRLVVTERNRPVAELAPLRGDLRGVERLVAEGRVTAPLEKLDFTPVKLRGRANQATASLEYVRGERG